MNDTTRDRPATALPLSGLAEQVLDCAMDAVVIIDGVGTVLFWNAAATGLFGYRSDEVLGRNLVDLVVPSSFQERHLVGLDRAAAGQGGALLGRRIEVVGRRRDGSEIPIELTITQAAFEDGVQFIGYLRDISDRKARAAELQASRRRLVNVSDEARRRLERDLHDGAQQQLVAVAMCLTAAQGELDSDLHAASTWLDRANRQLTDAVGALRELARGVHPEVLTRRGLAAAVTELARQSGISVSVPEVTVARLATDIEVAAYYVVSESLTNAAKHGARHASVTVGITAVETKDRSGLTEERRLTCVIDDDGPGGASVDKGTGLRGLIDRWAAVGGELTIQSPVGCGTRVTAVLKL